MVTNFNSLLPLQWNEYPPRCLGIYLAHSRNALLEWWLHDKWHAEGHDCLFHCCHMKQRIGKWQIPKEMNEWALKDISKCELNFSFHHILIQQQHWPLQIFKLDVSLQIILFLEKGKFIKGDHIYDNCELIKQKHKEKLQKWDTKYSFSIQRDTWKRGKSYSVS